MITIGGRKHKNELGEDVSYRHYKAEVLKHVPEVVRLSEMELEWEYQQPVESHDLTLEHVRLRKQYNAMDALHRYRGVLSKGLIGFLEKHDAFFSRKRGREWEIASDPLYPENGIDEDMRWCTPSQEQLKALKNSTIPEAKETDVPGAPPPKRQRRREGAAVSFHDDVYICTDADVDILRKSPSTLSQNSLEPAAAKPGPSICHTTPLEYHPGPKRSHTIVPLHAKDGNPGRSMANYNRRHKRYTPGRWAKSGGQDIVDTSGWTKHDMRYIAEMFGLQEEAAAMDDKPRPEPKMYHNGVEGTLMFMGDSCFWMPVDNPN
jgi:hypothetical protein